MSSWGPRSFEDDFACDWLQDLQESDAFAFFAHCLDLSDQDELDILACVGVRCTCEMIAGIMGEPRSGLPEAAIKWIETNESLKSEVDVLLPICPQSLARVFETGSAMQIKWQDAGPVHYEVWHDEMQDLIQHIITMAQRHVA